MLELGSVFRVSEDNESKFGRQLRTVSGVRAVHLYYICPTCNITAPASTHRGDVKAAYNLEG